MQQDCAKFDITGQTYGKLTAQKLLSGQNSRALWQCRCDCGKETTALYRDLVYGKTKSCGCTRTSRKLRDLTGQRFGRLVAQERLEQQKAGSYLWRCQCDCGTVALIPAAALIKGQTQSCGCLAMEARKAKARDLTGLRVGRLTVIEPTEARSANGGVIWRCKCDCGNDSFQTASVLRLGKVTSCGCKHKENHSLQRSLDYIDGTCVQFLQPDAKLRADNTSGVRGVAKYRDKWRASITLKKKTYYLGTFTELEEAVRIRKKAENVLYGEFLDWYHETFPQKRGREEKISK